MGWMKKMVKLVKKGQKMAAQSGALADEGTTLVNGVVDAAEGAKGLAAACSRGLSQLRGEAAPQPRKVRVEVVSATTNGGKAK